MAKTLHPRLVDIPVFASGPASVSAQQYNRARLAALRLGTPIYLHLPPLKHMAIIIDDDAWIVVDEILSEYPIVAWVEFDSGHRDSLHEPLACRRLYYHEHAERIIDTALTTMDALLAERLAPGTAEG